VIVKCLDAVDAAQLPPLVKRLRFELVNNTVAPNYILVQKDFRVMRWNCPGYGWSPLNNSPNIKLKTVLDETKGFIDVNGNIEIRCFFEYVNPTSPPVLTTQKSVRKVEGLATDFKAWTFDLSVASCGQLMFCAGPVDIW
jgi:hypothetical protein